MTSQKTYKIRFPLKRSGRDTFYGPNVKRRQIKAHNYKRQSRSSSSCSVMSESEIKPEASIATSRATSPDVVDTDHMAIRAPQSVNSTDEIIHQQDQAQTLRDADSVSNKVEAVCPKANATATALAVYGNSFRNAVQYPETWQQCDHQQQYDYQCLSVPSSASSSSSFESEASGSYSPYATNGHFYNSHYLPTPLSGTQTYPASSVRSINAQGFGASNIPGMMYGSQHPCLGHHGVENYEPVNHFNYRRPSEQSLHFTPTWGNFTHTA